MAEDRGRIHGTPEVRRERAKAPKRPQQSEQGGRPHPARPAKDPNSKDWKQDQAKPLPKNAPRPGNDGD